MSIKEIISNATTEMEQAIETIKELKSRLGEPIDGTGSLTETEQLCNDMEHSIERLNTIPITIIHAIMNGVYAGNAENSSYGIIEDDFGYDSLAHCKEYLELAEQYDPVYQDDGLIATDCFHNDLSALIYSIYTTGKDGNENLREIKTPLGIVYIEKFFFREEDERVKIYDSNKKYLDYISMETIFDGAEDHHCSFITILEEYIKYLEKCSTVEKLFSGLGINCVKYSIEWEVVADKLVEDSEYQINSVIELLDNDFVNQIGDYYIYISEN
jgi:hypothetical protein